MTSERTLSCDIAVIGGGPAGIAAALSARHFGAKVILVEATGTLGGMSTSGGLNIWCGTGVSRLQNLIFNRYNRRAVYDVEDLKCFYYTLLDDAGVKIITHAKPLEVNIEHGVITSAVIFVRGKNKPFFKAIYRFYRRRRFCGNVWSTFCLGKTVRRLNAAAFAGISGRWPFR